jgi:homoserine O-acetyltransferase
MRALAAVLLVWVGCAAAYDDAVQKQEFVLPTFTTTGGKTLRQVRVGWEAYGKLNALKSNVILVCQFFSGNSHAAGRYQPDDKAPGYWDSVIGPGKAFDTDKYYVISVDTLANLNTKDPHTITTGPATVNPDTGKPWGMQFPVVTMRDFVNVQKALLDSLGVQSLVAVTGASMGALQSVEWAAAYPDMVPRIIPVIPAGLEASAYLIATMQLWSMPIRLDPKWNQGDYYGKEEPLDGLAASLKLVTLGARHYGWAERTYGRRWADESRDPAAAVDNQFAIEKFVDDTGRSRATQYDANSFLYLTKAVQLYQAGQFGNLEQGLKSIRARSLWLPAASDVLLFPDYPRAAVSRLLAQGNKVGFYQIEGDGGHVDGLTQIAQMSLQIAEFLAE